MRCIKCENVTFDADNAFYDLALLYTQQKFQQALQDNIFENQGCPREIAELEFLTDTFCDAISYISNTDINLLVNRIDHKL